ncbi:hypothetical protein LguiA_035160 [Lonicera macranthoides]
MDGADHHYHHQSCSAPKTERKVIEKNRRNHMKTLYSTLCSLLPNPTSKEGLPLPDQIDEAVEYIKTLKSKMEKNQDKKNKLMGRKRSHTCMTTETTSSSSKLPQIEIHEIGPDQDLILINGLNNHFTFYEIIRVIHEEGAEVLHANFSTSGNSIFQLHREKIGQLAYGFEATTIYKRVQELINGSSSSSCSEVEPQLDLWDFEIQPDLWELIIPDMKPMGVLS